MITYDHFTPPPILGPDNIASFLRIEPNIFSKYYPFVHKKQFNHHFFQFTSDIYFDHKELDIVSKCFTDASYMSDHNKLMPLLVAMKPSKETILQSQEFIKNIATNDGLYNTITDIIKSQLLFTNAGFDQGTIVQGVNISSERVERFFNNILSLEKYKPTAKGFEILFEWIENVRKDKLYQEIAKEKDLSKQNRIISVAEPEFGDGIRYAKLKEGIKLEDFVEFYHPAVDNFETANIPFDHPDTGKHYFIEYTNGIAKLVDEEITISSRQNLRWVNLKTVELMTTSIFTAMIQLNHALAGTNFYKQLEHHGYPIVFPEILETPNQMHLKEIYSIRMIIKSMNQHHSYNKSDEEIIYPIDFSIEPEKQLIHVEGPNHNGKSELLRTIFLASNLINSGFPLPAKEAKYGLFPGTNFFKFIKTPGTGGSEFEMNYKCFEFELSQTYKNDIILIDEFGDTTNDSTACQLLEEIVPALLERNNTVITTSHQLNLHKSVRKLDGTVYKPSTQKNNLYQPVIAEGPTDFESERVLNNIGATRENLRAKLPENRPEFYRGVQTFTPESDENPFLQGEDIPL